MAQKIRPLTSVLVKPSGPDCNLSCTYCFYLEKEALFPEAKTHPMSPEVQEEMIRQLMQHSGDTISIGWQGGEPALMGLDFYKRSIELEKKYGHGQSVGNGFQTNGTLLDREWALFFREYDWLIGLSLDGPQHIHDRYRLDKGLHPTWEKVEGVARMLLQEGVAVNAMCCVTDYSADFAVDLYNYYKNLGLTWMQFIPIVETDRQDSTKAAMFSLTVEKYGYFLIQLFDLWYNDIKDGVDTTSVRDFDSLFHHYVGLEPLECTHNKECGSYVVIEHNGNVYSCDFFVEPRHQLGNIRHGRIIDMLNSKKQDDFGKAKALLPRKCKLCHWYQKCFGGCTKDRLKDPQDLRQPRFCQAYQMFFEHADEKLKQLANDWQLKQADYAERQRSGGVFDASDYFLKHFNS